MRRYLLSVALFGLHFTAAQGALRVASSTNTDGAVARDSTPSADSAARYRVYVAPTDGNRQGVAGELNPRPIDPTGAQPEDDFFDVPR
jgi:hypothetical protein